MTCLKNSPYMSLNALSYPLTILFSEEWLCPSLLIFSKITNLSIHTTLISYTHMVWVPLANHSLYLDE